MFAAPVLNTIQPIIGVDIHQSLPPVPPAPMPHAVVWGVGLTGVTPGLSALALGPYGTSKATILPNTGGAGPIAVGLGHACGRAHDAGPHVGHISPNVFLAIIWLSASSKAEFACSTVLTPTGPIAVNALYVMNLQLHCNDPVALPTGVAVTIQYNVCAGFSLMDLLAGLLHMLVDIALSWLIGTVLGMLSNAAQAAIKRVFRGAAMPGLLRLFKDQFPSLSDLREALRTVGSPARWRAQWQALAGNANAWRHSLSVARSDLPELLDKAWGTILGYTVGGPMGAAPSWSPYGQAVDDGNNGNQVDNWVDGLFKDDAD